MAWKDNPKIRDLEPYAKKHGYSMVIVMAVHKKGETFDITTYGRTREQCTAAGVAGDQLHDLVVSGKWPDWPDNGPWEIHENAKDAEIQLLRKALENSTAKIQLLRKAIEEVEAAAQ